MRNAEIVLENYYNGTIQFQEIWFIKQNLNRVQSIFMWAIPTLDWMQTWKNKIKNFVPLQSTLNLAFC